MRCYSYGRPSSSLSNLKPCATIGNQIKPFSVPFASSFFSTSRSALRPTSTSKPKSTSTTSTPLSPSSSSSSSSKPKPSSSSSKSSAYQKQQRREWLIVGIAGSAAIFGGYHWYNSRNPQPSTTSTLPPASNRSFSLSSPQRNSFSIPIRSNGQPGSPTSKVITSLTQMEVDKKLKKEENSTIVQRPEGSCLVSRYDTNSLASNDPIEDKRAEVIVERDRSVHPSTTTTASQVVNHVNGDLCFFAVMDGHAGYHTSTYLSQKLIAFVALELDKVFREVGEYSQVAKAKAAMPLKAWRMLFGGPQPSSNSEVNSSGLDGDPEIVKRAIIKAFKGLDKEICNTPIELLKEYELSLLSPSTASSTTSTNPSASTGKLSSLAHSIFPLSSNSSIGGPSVLTATQRTAYETLLPALSGSCALLTYIDSVRGDIYTACTGDSRSIAGYWKPKENRWEVETLSEDQTGRNEKEIRRIRSEHPASESDRVIQRGRVLGGLEPTRAFGDARYKWSAELQGRLYDAFLPGGRNSVRGPPRGLETPPYVTAQPEVEWRRIPGVNSKSNSEDRELKFIVMATDGLWDMISNEEVVALIAASLSGKKEGEIKSDELLKRCFNPTLVQREKSAVELVMETQQQNSTSNNEKNPHPLSKSPQHLKTFTFKDENLSTHLIRNALGGGNTERVAGLLAIPAPESRRYRDDITVNVILFNSPNRAPIETTSEGHSEKVEEDINAVKSKL